MKASSASKADFSIAAVQLVLDVSESSSSVHAILSPVAVAAADGVRQSATEAAAGAAAESHGDESAAGSNQAHSPHLADSAQGAATGQYSMASGFEDSSLAELQGLLVEEKKKTAALIGKTLMLRVV